MTDFSKQGNALLAAWTEGQRKVFQSQMEALDAVARSFTAWQPVQGDDPATGMAQQTRRLAEACEQQLRTWQEAAAALVPGESGDGVAATTLHRMLDPNAWLNLGGNELGETLRHLVEGPELADAWVNERKALNASREWLELQNKGQVYRVVVAQAWSRAFSAFMNRLSAPGGDEKSPGTWDQVLDLWLEIANAELIRTQRSEEFLTAQREFLRAGVDYRLRERDLVETFCEAHSMPTRTEVDDLHRTVTELRREVRSLKRQLAGAGKAKSTAARRTAKKAKAK